MIDSLAGSLIRNETCSSQSIALYEELREALSNLMEARSSGIFHTSRVLQSVGYDVTDVVADSYPFITSVWQPPAPGGQAGHESPAIEHLFRSFMADAIGAEQCVLRPPNSTERSMLDKALEAIDAISPLVYEDILVNVRHICVTDFARWDHMDVSDYREIGQSVSSHLIPSCCFFSVHSFSGLNILIEALYHEALHKKLSNLIYSQRVLSDYYAAERGPKFHSYWNVDSAWNSNRWEFDRALYAFHLYAHLIVFYGAVIEQSPESREFSVFWCEERRSRAMERCAALIKWLRDNGSNCLGIDGTGFLDAIEGPATLSATAPCHPNTSH